MYKGFNIRRGDKAEAFKKYLRTRNFYFEPSEDGDFIHFEVENPDDYVYDWIENMKKANQDSTQYVYEFPEGTTLKDINMARRLGLTYLGKAKYSNGAYGYFIQGTLPELQFYAEEYIGGYELHPDYLCPADEFAGIDELKQAGYFEDGKYTGKDKKVRLQGSKKIKDTRGIDSVVGALQKELQDLAKEAREWEEAHYDDYAEGKFPAKEYEEKAQMQGERSTAIVYLLRAYGVEPKIDYGMLGLYDISYLEEQK